MGGAVRSSLARLGGFGLIVGGAGFFAAGALHPHGSSGQSFEESMASMLGHSNWPVAHWFALVSSLLLAWAIWMLVDSGWTANSALGHASGRLAIAACLFMVVEFAVEIAAYGLADAYAAGEATPLVDLVDPLQAVGWPVLGLGFAGLAAGLTHAAPRFVAYLAIVSGIALGLAGVLVQGLHIVEFGPLFVAGNGLSIWIIWAGVRLIRDRRFAEADVPASARTQRAAIGP
jgi:hypothetical protein